MKTKICSKCKQKKYLKDFHKHKSTLDGYRNECKECRKKESEIYYRNNKKSIRKKSKIYRLENKELCKERIERWAKDNIFRYWASVTRRNHKPKYVIEISLKELTQMAENTQYCPICNVKLDYSLNKGKIFLNSPSWDRKYNQKKLNQKNTWIICNKCNTTKHNRTIQEFISYCKKVIKNLGGNNEPLP